MSIEPISTSHTQTTQPKKDLSPVVLRDINNRGIEMDKNGDNLVSQKEYLDWKKLTSTASGAAMPTMADFLKATKADNRGVSLGNTQAIRYVSTFTLAEELNNPNLASPLKESLTLMAQSDGKISRSEAQSFARGNSLAAQAARKLLALDDLSGGKLLAGAGADKATITKAVTDKVVSRREELANRMVTNPTNKARYQHEIELADRLALDVIRKGEYSGSLDTFNGKEFLSKEMLSKWANGIGVDPGIQTWAKGLLASDLFKDSAGVATDYLIGKPWHAKV